MGKKDRGPPPPKPEGVERNIRLKGGGEKEPTLQDLIREMPDDNELLGMLANMLEGPKMAIAKVSPEKDRHAAIVGAATVEHALRGAITLHMQQGIASKELKRLFDNQGMGPLSSFSARILIAYTLGILSDAAREDLTKIREIRNVFAHSAMPRTFREPALKKALGTITRIDTALWGVYRKPGFAEREQYVIACSLYYMDLTRYRRPAEAIAENTATTAAS